MGYQFFGFTADSFEQFARAVALATFVALRVEEELTASQVKECLRVGMSVAEIEEVLRTTARYADLPAADAGLAVLEAAVDASRPDVG